MILTTANEARDLDSRVMKEYGIPEEVLMENAGASAAALLKERIYWDGAFTVIVCGTGNNGGDGFVMARYVQNEGAQVLVLLMGNPDHMGKAASMYRAAAEKMGIPIIPVEKAEDGAEYLEKADIIIDALIGTGLSKAVKGEKAALISLINDSRAVVVSVDIPSGLVSDTGRAEGAAVRADFTVALGSVKRGHVLYPGNEYTGTLLYSAIGMPCGAFAKYPVRLTEKEDVRRTLPVRSRISHKGNNGFIGIFAGSEGMEGAALLTGQGALYAGGGKIAVNTVGKAKDALTAKIPELMVSSLGDSSFFTEDMAEEALQKAEAYDVMALGPGLGREKKTQKFVQRLIEKWEKPMVLDADALFAAAECGISFRDVPGQYILPPHIGEFCRLTGLTAAEAEKERIDAAREFAEKQQVVLLLKGAPTVIACPDGRAWVNPTGNPGMAAGGMGDTLTGIIAALCGQGQTPEEAAVCGAYLHGLAGDLAAAKTPVGYRASDVARLIPQARASVMHDGRGEE